MGLVRLWDTILWWVVVIRGLLVHYWGKRIVPELLHQSRR